MKKFVKELRIVVGLIAESASFAFFSIKSDKLRTFLSLFGVTVGIFSIVAVFCAVDSLKSNIMEGVRSFGSDIVYIDRFPMTQEEGEDGRCSGGTISSGRRSLRRISNMSPATPLWPRAWSMSSSATAMPPTAATIIPTPFWSSPPTGWRM